LASLLCQSGGGERQDHPAMRVSRILHIDIFAFPEVSWRVPQLDRLRASSVLRDSPASQHTRMPTGVARSDLKILSRGGTVQGERPRTWKLDDMFFAGGLVGVSVERKSPSDVVSRRPSSDFMTQTPKAASGPPCQKSGESVTKIGRALAGPQTIKQSAPDERTVSRENPSTSGRQRLVLALPGR